MKIYNRLINEGISCFWEDENESDKYIFKLNIFQNNKKVELLITELPGNIHFYSIDKLGSGDYQIEVSSYKSGKLVETSEKKINLTSTIQKMAELVESFSELEQSISKIEKIINEGIKSLKNEISSASGNITGGDWSGACHDKLCDIYTLISRELDRRNREW